MTIKNRLTKFSIALLSGAALGAAVITTTGNRASADEIYTVKSGDTLSAISYKFGLNGDYNSLAKANGIKNVNIIEVGQKLVITDDGNIKEATQAEVSSLPEVGANSNTNVSNTNTNTNTNSTQNPNRVASSSNASSNVSSNAPAASGSEAAAKAWIAGKESGGSYTARNGQYYGKYQLTSSYLNGDYSAANQERVADNYVKSRYGSWSGAKAAWQAQGWY